MNDGIGPQQSVLQLLFDVRVDQRVADVDEAAREVGVVVDEPLAEVEDIHV